MSITVKPMNSSYVLDTCFSHGPIVPGVSQGDPEVERAHRLFLREVGTCALLAWDGGLVVGFLTFYPAGSLPGGVVPCPWHLAASGGSGRLGRRFPMAAGDRLVLEVGCLTVCDSPLYRNRGIASLMVEQLVTWAGGGGWEELRVPGARDTGTADGPGPRPPASFWHRFGFEPRGESSLILHLGGR